MNMLDAPLRGCVRKPGVAIFLQRHALNLHQMGPVVRLQTKVDAGRAVGILRLQRLHIRQKTALCRPLAKHPVGGLRIHIHQQTSLFHRDQIIGGFSRGILRPLQIDPCAGEKQLPAPARIFHMAHHPAFRCVHQRDKAVWPLRKAAGKHRSISHRLPSFRAAQGNVQLSV
ncbi:hypothetical protein SDC9_74604 [bioreactor metagenome]|uniref:Uncharacterized protein n=1 Tax=bioreactor metagenome TaxID=1076179 RepID=A0A644YIG5_9ZZZZ